VLVSLPTLIAAIEDLPELDALIEAIPSRAGRLSVSGLHGSADALIVAALARRITTRLILIVSDDVASAERWLADLSQLVERETDGMLPVAFYPPRESFGEAEPHAEIAGERVETLERMARGAVRVVVTTSRAILERTPLPGALESSRLEIRKGATRRPESLAGHLESVGFERVVPKRSRPARRMPWNSAQGSVQRTVPRKALPKVVLRRNAPDAGRVTCTVWPSFDFLPRF